MNVLIDIGHPAHVHLYKKFYFSMINKNHNVYVIVKSIDSAKELLNLYNIPFIDIGPKKDSNFLKGLYQLKFNWKVFRLVRKYNIQIGVGSSITLAHVSKFTRMNSIVTNDDDDDVDKLFSKYAHPFANVVLSPDVLMNKRKGDNCIFYSGYHELAYLHPNSFRPNKDVLQELGIKYGDKYFIMRFNAFKASHDVGVRGLTLNQKLELIKLLKPFGKIFITTEREIEPELRKYQMKISPEKAHSLLYYATMFLGDSQTMTSEAAVLGVPSVRCNSFAGRISYLEEEEHKYKLTYGFKPEKFHKLLKKVKILINNNNLKAEWELKKERMLEDKIDVSKFLVWFIENYPHSIKLLKENPDYQFRFKKMD